MRILHTSDWHIGRTLHGFDLSDAMRQFCDWLVDSVSQQNIDLVLISGDVFDRAIPSTDAIELFNDVLLRLSDVCSVILTSGNHDSATRLGSLSGLLRDQLRIVTDVDQVGQALEFSASDGSRVLVYPIPYLEPDAARHRLSARLREGLLVEESNAVQEAPLSLVGRSHQAVIEAALSLVEEDLSARRRSGDDTPALAMVHAFITGGRASDSERDITVGGIEDVRSATFDLSDSFQESGLRGLDYIAAGHLHRPQDIGWAQLPIRYSGSPIAYSFSEVKSAKSVTIIDIDAASHDLTIHHLPTPVWKPMAVLEGDLDVLLSEDYTHVRDHLVSVTVTDDQRPASLNERVRAVFPHALVITHRSPRQVDIGRVPDLRKQRSDTELCTAFFEEVGQRPLSQEERSVISDLLTAQRVEAGQA